MGKDGEWEWSKNEKHRLRWGGGGSMEVKEQQEIKK